VARVLSSQEQRIWDDVLWFWVEKAEEPPLATPGAEGSSPDEADLPIAVVAGTWPDDCSRFGAVAQLAATGFAIPVRSSTISRSWWSPDHGTGYNGASDRGEL
jgi:hypothetical protein